MIDERSQRAALGARREATAPGDALSQVLDTRRSEVERLLADVLPREAAGDPSAPVAAAMRYAVGTQGKRIRPILVLLVEEMLGAPAGRSQGLAACVELLHTASLVLDDLPCMDDAELRRGRPALHRATDEATAILAAESLLVLAFDVLATRSPGADPARLLQLVSEAARTVGQGGMIGGQYVDLMQPPGSATREVVELVHHRKTARLFEFAARGAGRLANASEEQLEALATYGHDLGIAFQIADDLLDATQPAEVLGKDAQKDAGKASWVSVCGLEGSRASLDRLVDRARGALVSFGPRARALDALADFVRTRCR